MEELVIWQSQLMNRSQLNALPVCESAIQLMPQAVARKFCVLPIRINSGVLHVVLPSDHAITDPPIVDVLEFILARKITYETCDREAIAALIDVHYASDYSTISNCEDRFATICPKRWTDLKPTQDAQIRFCNACHQNVYFCRTEQQLKLHAKVKHCIAVYEFDTWTDTLGIPHTED